jgi:hypothetical protein
MERNLPMVVVLLDLKDHKVKMVLKVGRGHKVSMDHKVQTEHKVLTDRKVQLVQVSHIKEHWH